MSERKATNRGPDANRRRVDLTPNRLPQLFRSKADAPAEGMSFIGYLGESDRPDHVRLYVDPELRSWLEIARKDILHRDNLDDWPRASDVAAIWVRRDAKVGAGGMTAERIRSEMLSGELIRRYLADSVTDDEVLGFTTTMICATIAITWQLCVTPSCEDITVPLICDGGDDDEDDEDTSDTGGGDDEEEAETQGG